MLAGRIHNTLRFFDLQQYPLTAWEIYHFLIADIKTLRTKIDNHYELQPAENNIPATPVHFDTVLTQLRILVFEKTITQKNGFYCLAGREQIIDSRQQDYLHGLRREKYLNKYLGLTKHLPFVRSVVLLGSQAMGHQKPDSDIDLFVITDEKYLGTARAFLTVYFQLIGLRRHGKKIANRFCLNHYLAGPRSLKDDRNLYTALEYLKYRPLVNGKIFKQFLQQNKWVTEFFPHASREEQVSISIKQTPVQKFLESLFQNSLGQWFEQKLLAAQLARINKGEFNISNEEEMSFHPDNRKQKLFESFFEKAKV